MDRIIVLINNLISVLFHKGITRGQDDITAFIGDSVRMECEPTFDILEVMSWYFEEKEIFYYYQGVKEYPTNQPKYIYTVSGKRFILLIEHLNIEDGGTYTCSAPEYASTINVLVLGRYK